MASSVVYCGGRATFGMPFGIGLVVSMSSGIGPVERKLGVAMLIQCR